MRATPRPRSTVTLPPEPEVTVAALRPYITKPETLSESERLTASRASRVLTPRASFRTPPARFAAATTVFCPVLIRSVAFLARISSAVQPWEMSSIPLASKTKRSSEFSFFSASLAAVVALVCKAGSPSRLTVSRDSGSGASSPSGSLPQAAHSSSPAAQINFM